MSLDKNLFTLNLTPNSAGTVVNLIDGSGTIHYRKRRIVDQQVYRIELSDPLSDALLASATAPNPTSKQKTLELYNPSIVVELKYTGTLAFRWSFEWETHEFEWKREKCFIIRKPDPPVLVAVTKEPPGRIRTSSVQILDYNLNRFDIEDRKGLEIVILTALLTFQDASDTYHEPSATTDGTPSAPPKSAPASTSTPPPPPPKPTPKKGIDRIAELQQGKGQVNEVSVLDDGAVTDYAKYCTRLLQDEAMLFISVRSADPDQVSKVLHVVEETKRLRYKAGDPDLHQYVLYGSKEGTVPQKGPRIINLDHGGVPAPSPSLFPISGRNHLPLSWEVGNDNDRRGKNKAYSQPESLTVHLSKIDMPELQPRGTPLDKKRTTRSDKDKGKKKDNDQPKHVKTKDGDRDQAGQAKQTSPPRQGTSAPPPSHPSVLRKYRSQYFQPTPPALSPTRPGPSHHPPPVPPRTYPAHGPAGTIRRQSMYGSLNQQQYCSDYQTHGAGNQPSTSGRLGTFLYRP